MYRGRSARRHEATRLGGPLGFAGTVASDLATMSLLWLPQKEDRFFEIPVQVGGSVLPELHFGRPSGDRRRGEAKRRRDRAADSQPKFVPPQPSDTRPTPEKPAFVPPLPKPKVVGVAVEHFVPSFLVAPVHTTTSVNTRVLVYTDNEGNSERPRPEEPVFVPPLPEPKVVRVAVEHFEARRHGYTCSGHPGCGGRGVVSFVDAGEVVTAFCHGAGWPRIACDRCTSGGMSEWVPRRRFIRRSDLAQEEAFCSEHGEGRCTGDEYWFTGC